MSRAPYASDPATSRGRRHREDDAPERGPRNAFQRDRDRIIHSIAFRRLRHKTQVFIAPDGDHYRVRLTHSLEVAQIGRTVARALALDEDLTEGLCLAHDIGHPPFGHAGEEALARALADAGGFDHNGHTIRVLTRLETPYPRWPGLNLSWELLEGLAKHNGPVTDPCWPLAEANRDFDLALGSQPSLEAQVAALADDIAYDNHDIDDGIRAGLLSLDQLMELPFIAARFERIRARHPGLPDARLAPELIREQIGAMVNDLIATTRRNIAAAGVAGVEEVRAHGAPLAAFSPAMAEQERTLKAFMYRHLYRHPEQLAAAAQAQRVIEQLFAAYRASPALLPAPWRDALPDAEPGRSRHIADYLAGMTDRFAERLWCDLAGAHGPD